MKLTHHIQYTGADGKQYLAPNYEFEIGDTCEDCVDGRVRIWKVISLTPFKLELSGGRKQEHD